jgi:hypothetical protein
MEPAPVDRLRESNNTSRCHGTSHRPGKSQRWFTRLGRTGISILSVATLMAYAAAILLLFHNRGLVLLDGCRENGTYMISRRYGIVEISPLSWWAGLICEVTAIVGVPVLVCIDVYCDRKERRRKADEAK